VTVYEFQPDYAVHPGEYLEEVLEARQLSKSEFAEEEQAAPGDVVGMPQHDGALLTDRESP
jgi:hypothetical protein